MISPELNSYAEHNRSQPSQSKSSLLTFEKKRPQSDEEDDSSHQEKVQNDNLRIPNVKHEP
jgi:hypothetical protein